MNPQKPWTKKNHQNKHARKETKRLKFKEKYQTGWHEFDEIVWWDETEETPEVVDKVQEVVDKIKEVVEKVEEVAQVKNLLRI